MYGVVHLFIQEVAPKSVLLLARGTLLAQTTFSPDTGDFHITQIVLLVLQTSKTQQVAGRKYRGFLCKSSLLKYSLQIMA